MLYQLNLTAILHDTRLQKHNPESIASKRLGAKDYRGGMLRR
jgi:hypothetical protein